MKRIALVATLMALVAAACGTDTGAPGAGSSPAGSASGPCASDTKASFASTGLKPLDGAAKSLSGAGATFPAPVYSLWASEFEKADGIKVAYQSIGSGGGIQQITAKTVDFGASDAPMKPEEMAKAKGTILHIPTVLGAVVATYKLNGVSKPLRFDGETLGKIFAARIKTWDDPAITALNPGVKLPSQPIVVVHRSDGSGTTAIFTDYLSKASPSWVQALGGGDKSAGKEVAWPAGVGGKGNEGVSAAVQQTPGSIGYVELTYALEQNLPAARIRNLAGDFVQPCIATVSAAAQGVQFPPDLRFALTNAKGKNAYPITGATWLLVYKDQADTAKAAALVNWLVWIMDSGEQTAPRLHYAPLSASLRDLAVKQIKSITVNAAPLIK